jgi:hypothetical protein
VTLSTPSQTSLVPRVDRIDCTTECIRMTGTRSRTGKTLASADSGKSLAASEVWQARIGTDLASQLREDADVLGLDGRTEIVKAALALLHRHAAEERMGKSIDDFYGDTMPPLPIGVPEADATI